MRTCIGYKILLVIFSVIIVSCSKDKKEAKKHFQVFEEVLSSHSNIEFSNDLVPDVSTKSNLLDFDYFYNGAGVGVGDINNDGLPDVFLSGNQVPNKLYLNKGNLEFEDISTQAGVNVGKEWANGVSYADINNDGWLDIYVSQGGPYPMGQRKNTLYINNGDLTFTESAEKFGLADAGISTQSTFFDYDKDGDMDCIVMNESEFYGYDPVTFHRLLLENKNKAYTSYSHLYRNDNGVFLDVTIESGITAPTFGLGLAVSDINNDGWLDIYIANDYYQPDNLYINRKNGTFSDRSKVHLSQMSFFGMGVDIADVNADGLQDIFVLDMASKDHVRAKTLMASMDLDNFDLLVKSFGFPYQYMFNSLLLNDGGNRFNNMAQLAGVATTDWSWAALIEDLDQDDQKDILVTNGYRKYATDNDFKNRVNDLKVKYNNNVPLEEKKLLYESIPSESLPNNVFKQIDNLEFQEVHEHWGLGKSTFSNGAATSDLDGDGDLDLIINNIDGEVSLYKNTSSAYNNYLNVRLSSDRDQYAKVKLKYGGIERIAEIRRVRGYMSSLEPVAHFGLGDVDQVDELLIEFLDGTTHVIKDITVNQTIEIDDQTQRSILEKNAKKNKLLNPLPAMALGIAHKHVENDFNDFSKEVLLPYKQSAMGPCLAKSDLNGDGIEDLFLGGASGQPGVIYISEGEKYELQNISIFNSDASHEDVAASFVDIDSDGDQDLIVVSGGNEWAKSSEFYRDRLYINDNGSWKKKEESAIGANRHVGGSIELIDFDNDGDQDVLIGNRIHGQQYPVSAASSLFLNTNGSLKDVTKEVIPELIEVGIVNDIQVSDINGDGWEDIMLVGEWEEPKVFENKNGHFELVKIPELGEGLWFSITATDVDGDGDQDFLLGNIGLNYKLHASKNSPLLVYAGDLDNNATHDLVLSKEYKGAYVPVRGKECSSEQSPFITDKFDSYASYASSSLIDVYGESNLESSYVKKITTTNSVLLINEGDFQFSQRELPRLVQSFPIRDAISLDLNEDGLNDLIAIGTIYDTEVETPRLDAGTGLVLINDGEGYKLDSEAYYLYISGDLRSIDKLDNATNRSLIVLRNDDAPYFVKY